MGGTDGFGDNAEQDGAAAHKNGIERRSLVLGAAWSVPVIALTVATPLAAASVLTPTLAFVNGPYTAAACGTLNDVTLLLTTDGTTPDPGKVVTVSPPAGFTWSDGTTTARNFTTNANGRVVLPSMTAPTENGTFALNAVSGSLTASQNVTVSGATATIYHLDGSPYPAIPGGVTVDSFTDNYNGTTRVTAFLGSDGNLYRSVNSGAWAVYATGVSDFTANQNGAGLVWVSGNTVFSDSGSYPATPGGQTIADVQDTWQGGVRETYIRTASGNVYSSVNNGPWTLKLTGVTVWATEKNSRGGVAVKDNQVYLINTGNAMAATPATVTIAQVADSVGNNSQTRTIFIRGISGRIFVSTNGSPWSVVTNSSSMMAPNNNNSGGVYVDNNQVITMSGTAFPPTPAGATIGSVQDTYDGTGTRITTILGTGGRLYRSTNLGAWTLVANGVSDVQLNENAASGVYAIPNC
ncbi:hypothetical protein [Herbiconiux ginsengi]|uniref:Uncharacterized protein n=1 Tax=Herbiconiux ginsengi TaxID=381665 RepID=A0A1H3SQD3_9MICO|nr:hypothetical protein [Herbiconiux ginsengi]SDZ39775.1 hypothetical protein SAMN05216554_3550 [Herbiconiux ginsengi]